MRKSQTALLIRWRWALTGLAIVASALLLSATACGGDNGGNDNTGADASATPTSGTPGASQISDEVSKKLKDLGVEWAKTTVKVTYNIASRSGTETTKSTLVLYWAPPKVRVDLSDETDGTTNQTSVISTPDKIYSCSQEGGDECLAYPPSNVTNALPFLSGFDPSAIEADLSGLTGLQIESTSEKVSGNDASCVSAEGNIGGQDGFTKWCFATSGLLLFESFADAAGTSEFVFQATDIGTVSDSDFEPPYPVSEVSESPTPSATPGG